MKLSLGGGVQKIDGYKSVDLCEGADIRHDLKNPLPLEANSVEEIMAIHVIESFYKFEFLEIIKDWARVLNGKMTIEFTELERCCKLYLSDDPEDKKYGKWGFYGNQDEPLDPIVFHKYDYTKDELEGILKEAGFKNIEFTIDNVAHNPKRDLRVICSS